VRGLLIELADQLPPVTVGRVEEMIDANEGDVALDMLSEMLVESGARLGEQTLADVASLVAAMGLSDEVVNRLRPLVE
jgi:hypothetical protein